MLNKEREQEILNILKAQQFVSVKQLCDTLFASESSIRRDLKALEANGLVKRSYGGASLVTNYSNIVTFHHRTRQHVNEKTAIAQKAATLVRDGDIVFLDQSSTAFYLATELMHRPLTVVTNNIEIMMLLSHTNVKLISSGGVLSEENRNCLVGSEAQKTFENVFADHAFFSVKAIADDGIVTDCATEEIAVRRAMPKNARPTVLLCDSTKFGAHAPFKQCALGDVDVLISEGDAAERFAAYRDRVTLL